MKTWRIDTVRELREWLDEHQVSSDAKIEVWCDGGARASVRALVLGQRGASQVVVRADY